MIVALHITSESADHYLLLFKDKNVVEIKDEIYNNEEYYGASVTFKALDANVYELKLLEDMLYQFEEDSWEWG